MLGFSRETMEEFRRKTRVFCSRLRIKLIQLNFFDSDQCRSDQFHFRTAILSTRIYIILLIFIATILIISNAFNHRTEQITIHNPPQSIYELLLKKYPQTLSCRCRHTTIPFRTFTTISTDFHPICSSEFISYRWIERLFDEKIGYYFQLDFRSIASGYFQLLASFCTLANETVHQVLDDFLSSTFLSVHVHFPRSLDIQTQSQSLFVQKSSTDTIQRLVQLIRDTTYINQLQTARQTTGLNRLYLFPEGDLGASITDGCYYDDHRRCCCSSKLCSVSSAIFSLHAHDTGGKFRKPNGSIIGDIRGFLGGCYLIESLLHSTLECLFDRDCLDYVLKFFPRVIPLDMEILQINRTKFPPEMSIGILINELFIEQWTTISSFANYYQQCAPIACTYILIERNSVLFSVTTVIGLYGGLTVILRLSVPQIIQWYRNRIHRRRIRHACMFR